MKTGISIGVVVLMAILGITYFMMSIGAQKDINVLDNMCIAEKAVVESKLDAMNKTLRDFVGVTKKESETFLEFQKIVASSKEGQSLGGMMTAITEVYPTFDVKGFTKLFPTIEAQRKEFHTAQVIYNDRIRAYNTFIGDPINSMFIDLEKYKLREQFVVSSSNSKKAMETGIDDSELEF